MERKDRLWIYYGIILALLLLTMLSPFRDIIAYSVFIYYIARPLYDIIQRIIGLKTTSAIISLIIIILPIILITSYTFSLGVAELTKYAQTIPEEQKSHYTEMIITKINITDDWNYISDIGSDWESAESLLNLYDNVKVYFFAFLGIVFNIALVFLISFYLIRDGKKIREILTNLFENRAVAEQYFESSDKALFRIFFGNILNAAITAIIAIIVYNLFNTYSPSHLNLPYPVLLAILTGIASLVPMVGVKLIWLPAIVYLAFSSYINATIIQDIPYLLAFFVAVNIIVDMIPDLALRPFVTAKGIHMGAMMFGYIFGPLVFGISGIFIGPIIVVLVANYIKIVLPALKSG